MSQDFGISASHIWDGSDNTTDIAAVIRMQFVHYDFANAVLTEEAKQALFKAVQPELQKLLDDRFGPNLIRARNARVMAGSIELYVELATVGGAVYVFFKDYEDLRKGVLQFVDDVRTISSTLFGVVRAVYGEARKKRVNVKQRGTVSNSRSG